MKRILVLCTLIVLIGFGSAHADHLGNVTTGTWLNIPFEAIDTSSGTAQTPDSVWVMVWYGNQANGLAYSASATDAGSAWWDTAQAGTGNGAEQSFFFDMVGDIDADSGAGLYTGQIVAWKQTKPFRTPFSFTLIDSNFNTMVNRIGDINSDVQDIWEATEPMRNRLDIYVSSDGSDDSSGLTWQAALASPREALYKCSGAEEYFIYIGPGTYSTVVCTLDNNHSNTHIIGAGAEQTILQATSAGSYRPQFLLAGTTLKGVEITGIKFTDNYGDNCAIEATRVQDFEIHYNIINNGYASIWCGRTRSSSSAGPDSSTYGHIHHNIIRDYNYDGIRCDGSWINIHHNTIDSSSQVGQDGIACIYGDHNMIYNNYIRTTKGPGVILYTNASSNLVANNFVWATTPEDSAFYDYGSDNMFVGNHHQSLRTYGNSVQEDWEATFDEVANIDGWNPITINDSLVIAQQALGIVQQLIIWEAAQDGWEKHLWPAGSGSKDSVDVWDGPRETGNKMATFYFYHTGAIIDSTKLEIW